MTQDAYEKALKILGSINTSWTHGAADNRHGRKWNRGWRRRGPYGPLYPPEQGATESRGA